uniref:Cryptochrome DASH n=1 Tax=uncultured Flavobacteriia bacterium TaxID=212695 RepID=H6RHA8_9BACT|nr:deoxyribodipyrimidine photolyase [uncultured Flavobacteriia bacterium]CCG00419.1 deoxyribodipyrimidine photolyase [uncultured Flavobacteriia bacterium]
MRIEDNISLSKAINNSDNIFAFINIDPKNFLLTKYGFKKTEKYRAKFLLETISDLKSQLDTLNISLIITHKDFDKSIKEIINNYEITNIYTQTEWTRDELKEESFIPDEINLIKDFDQFLFSPNDVKGLYDNIPRGFSNFRKKCEKYLSVNDTLSIPNSLNPDNKILFDYSIPTLSDLGFEDFDVHKDSVFRFKGGETNAKDRIKNYFFDTRNVSRYKLTRNGLIGEDYSSKFSPWLANGSVSVKYIFKLLKEYETKVEKNDSTYWLYFELIWRDFFKYVSMQHKDKFFNKDGIYGEDKEWSDDKDVLLKWINGKTDEPFINANMIELSNTGFMSNRGRQNVANYLTKELKIDWRIGAEYFESMLIDYDVHSNYGNWLYNAGIGNDSMPFRKFNPKLQSERYDPDKSYEKTWLDG